MSTPDNTRDKPRPTAHEPTNDGPRARYLAPLGVLLLGLAVAAVLHWPALTDPLRYKADIMQQPNWASYHLDTFRSDDLLVHLANYNESPLQNLIYWIGTLFVDMVLLTKVIAVIGYGLSAVLFFYLGKATFGIRGGVLTAVFWTLFPDSFEYFAGGFSKMWIIPLLGLTVVLMDRRAWRTVAWVMPFAALAYPVTAVHMGLTLSIHAAIGLARRDSQAPPLIKNLLLGGTAAFATLAAKYLLPSERIGTLTSGDVLRSMPEMYDGGMHGILPLPALHVDLMEQFGYPFVVLATLLYLGLLGRKVVWRRSWTSLLLASVIGYLLADFFFMQFYLPNRYTRYSALVILAFWNGGNLDLILNRIRQRTPRALVLVGLFAIAMYLFREELRLGKDTFDRTWAAPLCEFVSTLPPQSLIAGHPDRMNDIPIQARRSVLATRKLSHPWYPVYYDEIRERTLATFQALYAQQMSEVDQLHTRWGVTHLVVLRDLYAREWIEEGVYGNPYNDVVRDLARDRSWFVLLSPPRDAIVYLDDELYVIRLPLAEATGVRVHP